MTILALTHEFAASKERFQRTLMISLGLHLILFAWLMLRDTISEVPEGIVEIAWLDPLPEVQKAPAPVPVQAKPEPVPSPQAAIPSKTEEKFERQPQPAMVEPTPQEQTANRDKIKKRLAALTTSKIPSSALTVGTQNRSLLQSAPVDAAEKGMKSETIDLNRGEKTRPKPAALKRGPVESTRPAPALAPVTQDKPAAAAATPDIDSVARRTLAGAELAGEIANRPVIEHTMPVYPEWAKSQAVEATVTLYFVVLPDGRVKENIQIQKTAGFTDFDTSAITALAKWRFQALTGGAANEQWGTIKFRFRLRN